MNQKNLAVFISGYGSNLNIFLQNKDRFGSLLVVSSKSDAYGLVRAKEHEVPSLVLPPKVNWGGLHADLIQRQIDLIFLAGFMKIVPSSFVKKWQGQLFNLHPSQLPHYRGLRAIERAYEAGDDIGVSIHHVTAEVDAGKIVAQETAVDREQAKSLSLEQVTDLVHRKEHEMVKKWIMQWC